eukprot:2031561-Prymnesium_polylepis.1
MVAAAGGKEHVVPLMTHHKKANPTLYKLIGMKDRVSLSADVMVSIVVKSKPPHAPGRRMRAPRPAALRAPPCPAT